MCHNTARLGVQPHQTGVPPATCQQQNTRRHLEQQLRTTGDEGAHQTPRILQLPNLQLRHRGVPQGVHPPHGVQYSPFPSCHQKGTKVMGKIPTLNHIFSEPKRQ